MGWRAWFGGGVNHEGETPNANPDSSVGPGHNPGDPHGIELVGDPVESRSFPTFFPSAWDGWPAEWSTAWTDDSRFNALLDVAWMCLDRNAEILSTLPVYQTRGGNIMASSSWMTNPDDQIYSDWTEFAKQLFWDFQLGEAFVLPMSFYSDGYPMRFRVIPPWAMDVEMGEGQRRYKLGGPTGPDVSNEILHLRYKSSTSNPRGSGPLENAGARMVTAGVIAKYIQDFAKTGGVQLRTLETDASLTPEDAHDLQEQYMASKVVSAIAPPVLDGGVKLVDHSSVSPKDAAMLELGQFTESRIAELLGVPPFLVGLPSGGDSLTYSNVTGLFDFHDRSKLRPLATRVMKALSYWALPAGQAAEINRDEYSRPDFAARSKAWLDLITAGVIGPEDVRKAERFQGEGVAPMTALTGGED
jgi:HK97 family phage portal protein